MTNIYPEWGKYCVIEADKKSEFEVCPKCASPSRAVYDHRTVTLKDAPIRAVCVKLRILKRRFWCKPCKRPFAESVPGISKGKRHTARYRRELFWRCENFLDLKRVRKSLDCSSGFLYKALYEELQLRRRERTYPWPSKIGIDEHSFKRNKQFGYTEFVTFIIDQKNKKAFEAVCGRTFPELDSALRHIPRRENVELVTMDLSSTYRQFVRRYFPSARIVADKFHVIRLLNPAINRYRKEITGDKRSLGVRRLLLRNGKSVSYPIRLELWRWLERHPDLKELYHFKEALHGFYRCKGYNRAREALTRITERMAASRLPEAQTLRRTLLSWFNEILEYFKT